MYKRRLNRHSKSITYLSVVVKIPPD